MTLTELADKITAARGDRSETGQPDITISVYQHHIEVTRRSTYQCSGCGQSLSDPPGQVLWISETDDDVQGAWSHQHGCGQWNTPHSVWAETPEDIDTADSDDVADWLDGIVGRCDDEVAAIRVQLSSDAVDRLKSMLAEVLVCPEDEREDHPYWTALEAEDPGVYLDGDVWTAWDWDPLTPGSGDCITVTSADLAP